MSANSPSLTPATRVDRRRERTRRRLLDAGRRAIAERGIEGLRIQDVTDTADVALGSFYNYFGTKEELVEAIVTQALAELVEATVVDDAAVRRDPAATASAAVRRVVRLTHQDPDFARLILNLARADTLFVQAFRPYAKEVVDRGIQSSRFSVPDVEIAVSLVLGGTLTVMRGILDGHYRADAEQPLAELALRALGIPAAEARTIPQLELT